jgi:hypothetical protein
MQQVSDMTPIHGVVMFIAQAPQLSNHLDHDDAVEVEDFMATISGHFPGELTTVRMYKGSQAKAVRFVINNINLYV